MPARTSFVLTACHPSVLILGLTASLSLLVTLLTELLSSPPTCSTAPAPSTTCFVSYSPALLHLLVSLLLPRSLQLKKNKNPTKFFTINSFLNPINQRLCSAFLAPMLNSPNNSVMNLCSPDLSISATIRSNVKQDQQFGPWQVFSKLKSRQHESWWYSVELKQLADKLLPQNVGTYYIKVSGNSNPQILI